MHFLHLSRPPGQMNGGGRPPKKGMCHCSSGSIHLWSCSPFRKQLVLACHAITKAVCHSHVPNLLPSEQPAPLRSWLSRGSEVSSKASDLGSWCHLMLCISGLSCCSAVAAPQSHSHVVAELRRRVLTSWPQQDFGPWSLAWL